MKSFQVTIMAERCQGCGLCREMCPKDIPESSGRFNHRGCEFYQAVRTEECVGCRRCLMVCPDFSIDVTESGGV